MQSSHSDNGELYMLYLEWADNLSVKVKEIDEQHKILISMINRLHDAMLANRGREIQKEIVTDLSDYVFHHFATEEKYMRLFDYPEYSRHKLEHEQFAAEAVELKSRVESGSFVLTLEVMSMLNGWLQNHILGTDMRYSDFFNSSGLS